MIRRALPNLRRRLLALLRFDMTDPGKLAVVATLMAVATGTLTLTIPIYHVCMAMTCLLIAAFLLGVIFRPRVDVSGGFAPKAVAGEPIVGHYTLTNRSRLPAYDLSLGFFDLPAPLSEIDPGRCVARLGGGQKVEMALTLQPMRRGLYELIGPRVYTTYPFNLFRNGPRTRRNEPLLVLPSFSALSEVDIPMGMRYQPGGVALTSNVGESLEYVGNRDYRPGDSLHHIDGRAWARLGSPVVREFQQEYYCRIALVLDTFIPGRRIKGPAGFAQLEAAVSLTAAVADAMSRGEYLIDLFAAGPDLYVFRAGRHRARPDSVLEILACVDECRRNPFAAIAPALSDELSNISSVVFVLLDWDDSREALVREAVERGCATKVLIVRRGETSQPYRRCEDWAGPIAQLSPEQVRRGALERL